MRTIENDKRIQRVAFPYLHTRHLWVRGFACVNVGGDLSPCNSVFYEGTATRIPDQPVLNPRNIREKGSRSETTSLETAILPILALLLQSTPQQLQVSATTSFQVNDVHTLQFLHQIWLW
jgi:hypothetical protein